MPLFPGLFMVIRLMVEDGHGTVNLFRKDKSDHLMGKCHAGEGNLFIRPVVNAR